MPREACGPVSGSGLPVEDRQGHAGDSPAKKVFGGWSICHKQSLGAGAVQPGEENARGERTCVRVNTFCSD